MQWYLKHSWKHKLKSKMHSSVAVLQHSLCYWLRVCTINYQDPSYQLVNAKLLRENSGSNNQGLYEVVLDFFFNNDGLFPQNFFAQNNDGLDQHSEKQLAKYVLFPRLRVPACGHVDKTHKKCKPKHF